MNRYYSKTSIYLDERQKKLINQYMPNKISAMVRDIIDYVLFNEIEGSKEFLEKPELLETFYEYKRYLQDSQQTLKQQQEMKKKLFSYYDSLANGSDVVAFVLSNKGKYDAIYYCKQTLSGFRDSGNFISDEFAHELIVEYVHMLHDTGRDDAAWAKHQKEYMEKYPEDLLGYGFLNYGS